MDQLSSLFMAGHIVDFDKFSTLICKFYYEFMIGEICIYDKVLFITWK
jgi:hypothetical protein